MKNNILIDTQINYLKEVTKASNFHLSQKQINQFEKYLIKLLEWNKRTNLISRNDEHNIVSRHFLESIAILDIIKFPLNSFVIDIGTGAGFPGIPIKIVRSDFNLTLLDSKRTKILFITDVLNALNLENVEVIRNRAEIACLMSELNQKFDFVFARAVAKLSMLYQWTYQFLKPGGTILAIKGGNIKSEIDMFQKNYEMVELKILPLKSHLIKKNRDVVIVQMNKFD